MELPKPTESLSIVLYRCPKIYDVLLEKEHRYSNIEVSS